MGDRYQPDYDQSRQVTPIRRRTNDGPVSNAHDAPVTQAQLEQVLQRLDTLTHMRVPKLPPSTEEKLGKLENTLTAGAKAWRVAKWAAGAIAASSAVVFAAGQWWTTNAMKSDIESRLAPVEIRVATIEVALKPIQDGVMTLVNDRNQARALREIQRQLATREADYQDALKAWNRTRRKAARPRKSRRHLKLEDDARTAAAKL